MKHPSRDLLVEYFQYDKDTGIFLWKYRSIDRFETKKGYLIFNKKFPGKVAGNIHKSGIRRYITIRVFGRLHYAHRLAWIYVNGEDPEVIDHIDGNGLNNRIDNLRSVSQSDNSRNQRLKENNKSGRVGVYFNKEIKKWVAQGRINGKTTVLCTTENFDDACSARSVFEQRNNYHANHGMVRV